MTDTQISITESSLSRLGLVEVGGGDGFTYYYLTGATEHAFYVFDDGHWEHRNFTVCDSDESVPMNKGRTLASLRRCITSLQD